MRRPNANGVNVVLLGLVALLLVTGIAFIYSTDQLAGGRRVATEHWRLQVFWALLGIAILVGASRVPLRVLENLALPAYAGSIVLLLVTLATGGGDGPARWIRFGGFQIQPSELAKLGVVLFLARVLTARGRTRDTLRDLLWPCAVAAIPAMLVVLQPNLGTAIVFGAILAGMLFWAGTPPLLLFLLLSPLASLLLSFSFALWSTFIVGLGVLLYLTKPGRAETVYAAGMNLATGVVTLPLWNSLEDYQKQRILVFLNPESDPRGAGWHLLQSQVAVGSGGLVGQGFLEGSQKRLAFLPEQHTDFIFSVVAEEMGFLGVLVALALFAAFVNESVRVAQSSTDPFGSSVAFGIATVFTTHVVVNVAMTVGMMPITGLPLPFFSYGGSFLLACFLAVAVLQRVWRERFARRI